MPGDVEAHTVGGLRYNNDFHFFEKMKTKNPEMETKFNFRGRTHL